MFNSLSKDTKKIWELMEKDEKEIYGTNDLLKVLINLKGGMFSIITSDYNIDLNDLNEYIDNTLSISYEEGKYTKKLLEVYKYFDGEIKDIRSTMCANDKAQAVVNANLNASIVALNSQVAQTAATLAGITRVAVPKNQICDFCCTCCNS